MTTTAPAVRRQLPTKHASPRRLSEELKALLGHDADFNVEVSHNSCHVAGILLRCYFLSPYCGFTFLFKREHPRSIVYSSEYQTICSIRYATLGNVTIFD